MRKNPSKSMLTNKKNKTVSHVQESKKNSRVVKNNSCVKINSQNTQQNSNYNATVQLSKTNSQQLSEKLLVQLTSRQNTLNHQIQKSSVSQRPSNRQQPAKSSSETIPNESSHAELMKTKQRNEQLMRENTTLKQKCCQLQEMSIRDKQKIKNLIIRINQVKQGRGLNTQAKTVHPSTQNLPLFQQSATSCAVFSHKKRLDTPPRTSTCENQECIERKKYLQSQLYKERVNRDRLQMEKRQWERNRELLKTQYNELLQEIRDIRNNDD